MTDLDQRRVAGWISEAFSILSVRTSGLSAAEIRLRLHFETLVRQLGSSPLRMVSDRVLRLPGQRTTLADVRVILLLLDRCLELFSRYEAVLTPQQRQVHGLVRETRRFAALELTARTRRRAEPVAA